ncbi:tyrosine--tRNA ligase [Candidatus Daviesbacteria bacterium]|nr:tyrosine--tRNA ligase [Candidatus Daviesbacteria bacterium]
MNSEDRFKLITRNLEEVLTEDELKALISSGKPLKHYIGFEVSGKLHIGQGLFTMLKIKDLQEVGVEITILIADWHTWLNKKLDGKLETATRLGKEYLIEAFKAGALCVGADPEKINFVLGSDFYSKAGLDYWGTVIKIAKATTLARMMRSTTIMGRKEGDISDSAMLIYPAMQSADIFTLGINLTHSGTDQRNVHIVARDSANGLGFTKPVALHHHLLQGLSKPVDEEFLIKWQQANENATRKTGPGVGTIALAEEDKSVLIEAMKMSKSKPDSAVFITDSPEEIKRKLNNAFCPEGEVKFNPILDWVKFLIFYEPNSSLEIKRDEKFGGDITYSSYEELEKDYTEKKLHPQDLKMAVAEWLIKKLEPARKYFEEPKRKAALEEVEKLTQR